MSDHDYYQAYAEEDDGHWWDDPQAIADHRKLVEDFNRECAEFNTQSEAWRLRTLQLQNEYFESAWEELAKSIERLGASIWR